MPEISVIVPVYKVEKYLNRCVDSILNQTFSDFELILVDDGSPDGCGKICDEYAEKDSRVFVIHKQNGGLSDARNAGIDYAMKTDSEWITFIDSDDWIHPKFLEILYKAVKETGLSVGVCSFEATSGANPEVDENNLSAETRNTEEFYRAMNVEPVVAWGKLYKKELLSEIRYPVGKIHEDEFINHRLIFQSESVAFVNAPLYSYFKNDSGIIGSGFGEKNLVLFDAFCDQIVYFKEHGLQKAYERAQDKFAYHVVFRINECDSAQLKKKMLKIMRRFLKNNKDYVLRHPEKKLQYEELAHPRAMRYYWIIKSRLKRNK